MNQKPYSVYVLPNADNLITRVDSDAFLNDVTGWIKIDEGYTQRHYHAQVDYFSKHEMDDRGIYRYRLIKDDTAPFGYSTEERTQAEMDADYAARPAPPPSDKERIKALEAQLAAYEAAYTQGVNEA